MKKTFKKKFIRILLTIYILSYFLHDLFFVNFANAEEKLHNTNIIALVVDKKIYENPMIKNKIQRYATEYIQKKVSDSKAIVLAINTENFKAYDIVKILENIYFDGLKDMPSKLVGVILIGNIPLPIVEQDTFIYPSIYPYVDFENQQFVYNADKDFFTYNEVPNGQAEVWHGIIKFEDEDKNKEIQKYEKYFNKLQTYNTNPSKFIAPKIRYDDFIATKEYFLTDNINYYINSFLFSEDVGYHRFTNLLLNTLKGEHNKTITNATKELINGISTTINTTDPEEQEISEFGGTIKILMDKFNSLMSEMKNNSNGGNNGIPQQQNEETPPSPNAPTLTLKSMIKEFLKSYDSLLATKYLTRARDNINTSARRYQKDGSGNLNPSFDSHYNKIILNDSMVAGNLNIDIAPIIMSYNDKLEKSLNKKIEKEKYYVNIPILTTHYDRTNNNGIIGQGIGLAQSITPGIVGGLLPSNEKYRSVFENFYFGKKASEIKSAEELSIYRGTYSPLQHGGDLGSVNLTNKNKGIGSTYNIFSQQIEANRGYNVRNMNTDIKLFDPIEGEDDFEGPYYNGQLIVNAWKLKDGYRTQKNSKDRVNKEKKANNTCENEDCEESGTSEEGQDVINKNRGGATPLNRDNNGKLRFFFYKEARQPIYDIAGSFLVEKNEPEANSYLGYQKYASSFKTKVANGKLAYIYPRALVKSDCIFCSAEDQSKPIIKKNGEFTLGNRFTARLENPVVDDAGNLIRFVPKIPDTTPEAQDFFSTFNQNLSAEKSYDPLKKEFKIKNDSHEWIYKTIDSRVFNISPTIEQINGYEIKKFEPEKPLHNLYVNINEEIKNVNKEIEKKLEPIHLNDIQEEINLINSGLNKIINLNINQYTGNSNDINNLANEWENTINLTNIITIDTGLSTIFTGLGKLDNFLISSKTKQIHPGWSNYEITSDLGLESIIQMIQSYQLSNMTRPTFFTSVPGKIEFLSGWINDIRQNMNTLISTYQSIQNKINILKNQKISIENEIQTKINTLTSKKTNIHNAQICGTYPNEYSCGCNNKYKALCDAIENLKIKLTNIKLKINKFGTPRNKKMIQENYITQNGVPIDREPAVSNAYEAIQEGIDYHNINGLIKQITQINTIFNGFTIINDPSQVPKEKIPGMDITTKERPIDNIRNVTFQGIGGGLIQFNYPNIYEVEIFKSDGNKQILKTPQEISQSIKEYLKNKVKEYNTKLQNEIHTKNTPGSFYQRNILAYNFLGQGDPIANPSHPIHTYNLMEDNYLIDQLGEKTIENLGKILYYQNITRPEKKSQNTVLEDIQEIKSAFDINKKIAYITQNYLKENNDQGPLTTPTYNGSGYEVAFINSDGEDYIKIKSTPNFITQLSNIQQKQIDEQNLNLKFDEETEDPIAQECKFDPSGSELIFDIKKMNSPRIKAFQCRLKETIKNPFKIKINYNNALGPTTNFIGEVDQSIKNRGGNFGQYTSQRSALNTENYNEEIINNATGETKVILKNIITYTDLKLKTEQLEESTSRELENQNLKKQLYIRSLKDLGELTITIQVTGDNCFGIKLGQTLISNNLCKKESLNFNPAISPKTFEIIFTNNKAGTSIVTTEFCIKNTKNCIKKAKKIEILPSSLHEVIIQTPENTKKILAGGELPIQITGKDKFGNILGLIVPEANIFVQSGDGELINETITNTKINFSDFKKLNIIYKAPNEIKNDKENINIYFSGLTQSGNIFHTIKNSFTIEVIKGFLNIYYQKPNQTPKKIFDNVNNQNYTPSTIEYSLDEGEKLSSTDNNGNQKINESFLPKIILHLTDKEKNLLTGLQSPILVSTQNQLLTPGEVIGGKFIKNGNFIIKNGKLEIKFYPNFKAGNDTLFISLPGIETIKIPIKINAGKAKKINIDFNKNKATPGDIIYANIKTTDLRDNPIEQPTNLKIGLIGALSFPHSGETKIINVTGYATLPLYTKEPGGEAYIYAKIDDLAIDKQFPGYKNILIQNTFLPTSGLNVMYLNLFGTDRGNQRGYFSDNHGYVNKLIDQSNKLLAVTTQLIDPTKLKAIDVIITQNGQIKNLSEKEINIVIKDKKILINIPEIGAEIHIGNVNEFGLEQIENIANLETKTTRKNIILYLPEKTDNKIQENKIEKGKIIINGKEIIDFNKGEMKDEIKIQLTSEKIQGYSKWDIQKGEEKIGQLFIVRNADNTILENIETNTNILNGEYEKKIIFASNSTNGTKGIGIYKLNSQFSKKGYKSIEDSNDAGISIGFTNNFKNITYFSNGKSVGEATLPFGSNFLINFGDPLLKRTSENPKIKNTQFDGSLGEPIYSDPTKNIFKVIPIDFNNDKYKDLLITYKDGTIKILKNYGGNSSDSNGNIPYTNLQDIMIIADSIKEIIVGDVDGNKYEDIIIWTNSNKLKVYTNNKGIFDVDGKLVCLNTFVKNGEKSKTPDDMGTTNQIFFKDMDKDGNLDIITNDNRGDIKIFYGGSNYKGEGYYFSNFKHTCDDGRYERQKNHMQTVRNLSFKINENIFTYDNTSLVHREGLLGTTQPEELKENENITTINNLNDEYPGFVADSKNDKPKHKKQKDDDEIEENKEKGKTAVSQAQNEANQYTNNIKEYQNMINDKYVSSPINILPKYETGLKPEQILYAKTALLSEDEPITIYKKYQDLNGDILEPGDIIRVTTTLGALKKGKFTYLENIQFIGNSKIEKNDDGSIVSFKFASGSKTGDILREVSENYDIMIDNIVMNPGEKMQFSYDIKYEGTPLFKIEIKDEEIRTEELSYVYEQNTNDEKITISSGKKRSKDNLNDILIYPINSCKKYLVTLFNTNEGDNKKYEDVFYDIQKKIDEDNAIAFQTTQNQISGINGTASQPKNLDDILNMPGMNQVFESWNRQSILNDSTNGGGIGIGINTNFIDQMTVGIQTKINETLKGLCQGFSIGKDKKCQGIPVPFNQAFLAPGSYHIFGCIGADKIPGLAALDNSLGKGLPVLAFPAAGFPPIRPPNPSAIGGLFGGSVSQIRVYLVPTLTLGMGIAICLGPYELATKFPKPFRDIAGNCIVFAIPPYTNCENTKDNGGESDQIINTYTLQAAQNGICNTTRKGSINKIIFSENNGFLSKSQETLDSPLLTLRGKEIYSTKNGTQKPIIWEGNFFGLSLDQKPIKENNPLNKTTAGNIRAPAASFNFGGDEKFELIAGEKITLKQLGSISKGLIKCIMKDRADRQILFLLNNLTKMTISISLPDLQQLGEGRNKLNRDEFKKNLQKENIENNITTKENSTRQDLQNLSNTFSNPFDAIMTMFEEVPLVNINTKDIYIKIPFLSSNDITKYTAYLNTRTDTNMKTLENWLYLLNTTLAFCGRISQEEAYQEIENLNKELDFVKKNITINENLKKTYIQDIEQEIKDLQDIINNKGETGRKKYSGELRYLVNNFQLTIQKLQKKERLKEQKKLLINKNELTTIERSHLKMINTRLEKVTKCGDFVNNIGKFLQFYENTSSLIQSIKQNIKTLELYKKFPLQLHERLHITDRYLTEITLIFGDFLQSITYWMKINANRFSKYVDALILMIGVIKTRQILIDFSVNRSKKCGKCTYDDYSPQSCSLSFLCPKLPVLKIPNFKIPNLYIDLSHINLGIDITLPNFHFKPISITLPKIPNLPNPPKFEIFLEYDYGLDLDIPFLNNLTTPTIPILPSPPELPELPSFIPNIKINLPTLPPAPKIPKISPKIETSIKIAEFIAKIYCIIKGGIGLVGEKGVKGKVEQLTQRTRNVPFFDEFDLTTSMKEEPTKGFDFKLDAYLELKYNFDEFYAFLNNIVQPINQLSNFMEDSIQKNIDTIQKDINNNDIIKKFEEIEKFQFKNLNSYQKTETMLDIENAYKDISKGLEIFQNKAKEKNDTKTFEKLANIKTEINTPIKISPAYNDIKNVEIKVKEIIKNKQDEIENLKEQIKNNYDEFIKSLIENPIILTRNQEFKTSITAPLFKTNQETIKLLKNQENPNISYIRLNKTVLDGYLKAINQQTPMQMNMSETTYKKSKEYLEKIDKKINNIGTILAYNDNNSNLKSEKILLAQNTTNSSSTCSSCSSNQTAQTTMSFSDISQFVRGVFVDGYEGNEKKKINVVKSEENVLQIGSNYIFVDINNDGNHENSIETDDNNDIIMRDANTIYIKYANENNKYGPKKDSDSNFYIINFESPQEITDESDDGYIKITNNIFNNIMLKLTDENQEVKNFKTQGQDFESISFEWMNSGLLGDKPDGYLIRLNQRIDTFNDQKKSEEYETKKEELNKKYVLLLPKGENTGGLISLKDGFSDKKSIQSLFTGNSKDAGTIIEIQFYDPLEEKISISLTEVPRKRQYAQIATLNKHQEKLTKSQAKKLSLYEISSPWSNQIVAGKQLIADTKAPEGEFVLYRPKTNEIIETGNSFNGFVSTNYIIQAHRKDNVAIQSMRIEKNGKIILFKSGSGMTGYIELSGCFYTGETKENRYFGAQDYNGNINKEQINLKIKIPEIKIKDIQKINEENGQIIAELSNDMDEGNVLFQRERNKIRNVLTSVNNISYFPLTGKQTIITGGIFTIGNTLGFYNILGKEVGNLNPKNGKIKINSGYESSIQIQTDISSHIPIIKIFDTNTKTTLFQINLPTKELIDIKMKQGTTKYKKVNLNENSFGIFTNGYCIKGQNNECIIYIGTQGQIYVPSPYNNLLKIKYEYDNNNDNILYHLIDNENIATISIKFKSEKF